MMTRVIRWDTTGPGHLRSSTNETMTNTRQTHDETDAESDAEAPPTDHLQDVEDGCGCTEIWEHLSEEREATADD